MEHWAKAGSCTYANHNAFQLSVAFQIETGYSNCTAERTTSFYMKYNTGLDGSMPVDLMILTCLVKRHNEGKIIKIDNTDARQYPLAIWPQRFPVLITKFTVSQRTICLGGSLMSRKRPRSPCVIFRLTLRQKLQEVRKISFYESLDGTPKFGCCNILELQ